MGGGKQLNSRDVEKLVNQSKELDTRFNKGSLQKSFL
jgi:hypothetical protein